MRKTLKKSLAVVLSAAMLLSVASVSPVAQAAPKAKKITLNAKSKKLEVGKKFTLKVKKVKPSKAKKNVKWTSSKKKVASVSKKGVVKALKVGKTTITATSKTNAKVKATCKITVIKASVAPTPVPTPAVTPTAAPTQAATPTVAPTTEPTVKPTNTPRPTPTPFILPEESLKENVDAFKVGTVINYDKISDKSFTALAAQQFDIVSFENEMKGYSLIDVGASASAVAEEGEGVVKCQFDRADEMVKWAKDNGLQVRGHVLFWEQSMAEAFFYQGYEVPADEEKESKLVDAETLKARMQSYAEQVITHFNTEFPDMVIAWDVVNEAIDSSKDAVADETTGLFLHKTGNFYKILGGEYIKLAFEYAKAAVAKTGKDIQLFYNDFNCFQNDKDNPKTPRIVELIKYLNADENNKLLDCMGMEGYVLTYWPNPSDVKKAMETFSKLGVKVGINELCIRLSQEHSADKTTPVTDADIEAHAKKCEDMFKVYCEFAKSNPGTLTNVSIWALTDRPDLESEATKPEEERHYDYTVYGTHSGLFTADYNAKDAFHRVIQVLKDNK
ncbi:MAG: hypothetical protein HFH14_09865 [Lachnospiraceae bacterium]|nr:hypothetical protein [Lachnospiraceae bacterium]